MATHPQPAVSTPSLEAAAPPVMIALGRAVRVFRSPALAGVTLAFFIVARFWPAGFDAQLYYLRWPPPYATTPYWVYLVTYPLSRLGWPLSWQVLIVATVLIAALAYALRGNFRWWVVVLSSPLLFAAWWGQVEVFSLIGLVLGAAALDPKRHPGWMGAAWMLLSIKIQSNYGLIFLLAFWFYKFRGLRAFLPAGGVCAAIFSVTWLIWPGWIMRLFEVYGQTRFGYANASLWPWGAAAWLPALLYRPSDTWGRMRAVAAASLLGSPYFTLHHCLVLVVLTDTPWLLLLTWLPIVMIFQTRDWSQYAWVIPLVILIAETAPDVRRRMSYNSIRDGQSPGG